MSFSTQAKVGLVTIVAILILGGMIMWKGDILLKTAGYELIGSFNNVGGLLEGADVRYRGYKVGKALHINPEPSETRVRMNIVGDIRVPLGSTLRIAFDGLIGQKYVEIMPSLSDKNCPPKSVLKGFSTLGLVDFIDVGTVNLEELKGILESVRKLTDDPATQKAVKESIVNIEEATAQFNRLVADINDIMAKEDFKKSLEGLKNTSGLIVKVSQRLDAITAAIEKLTSDPNFGEDIKGTAKEAREAMLEVKNAAADIRKTLRKLVRE